MNDRHDKLKRVLLMICQRCHAKKISRCSKGNEKIKKAKMV